MKSLVLADDESAALIRPRQGTERYARLPEQRSMAFSPRPHSGIEPLFAAECRCFARARPGLDRGQLAFMHKVAPLVLRMTSTSGTSLHFAAPQIEQAARFKLDSRDNPARSGQSAALR